MEELQFIVGVFTEESRSARFRLGPYGLCLGEENKHMEIYSTKHKDEILEKGEYSGFPYIIRTLGFWPCAYVGVPYKPDFDVEEDLCVPVLINYKSWEWARFDFMDKGWNWFGWDYGHTSDYHPLFNKIGNKYTMEDIREDIKTVIKEWVKKNHELEYSLN